MTSAIRLEGVCIRFGATRALDDVSLEVVVGERVALLGPNGAGKSTLLRAVAGLLKPSAGNVRVLDGTARDARVRRRIGVVMHEPMLYGHLTALENLRFWAALYGAETTEARDLLASLALPPDDARPVRAYSRGMRQRASLARALIHRPDVLVLDEPFAGLDEDGRRAAADLVRGRGVSMLLATHNEDGALGLTGRSVTLASGTVVTPVEAQ